MQYSTILLATLTSVILYAMPASIETASAADSKVTPMPEMYSDRDRAKAMKSEEDKLEQALKTGEEKSFYRREVEKAGWQITSVNYDKSDYLEYEIVKGKDTFEVQIDFDKNSHKASKVDVTTNIWKTDATKQTLRSNKKVPYPSKTTANPERFSDRDRMKVSKNEKEKLAQVLKTGEEKEFYRRELGKMNWKITSVNYDTPEYAEYEIVKGDTSYEVQINFDRNSHKATKVDVAYNAWQTDATDSALKAQTQARK
jgi:hypothetical protein